MKDTINWKLNTKGDYVAKLFEDHFGEMTAIIFKIHDLYTPIIYWNNYPEYSIGGLGSLEEAKNWCLDWICKNDREY